MKARARVVISEFMDEAAVAMLAARFDTRYDPDLVDRPAELRASLPAVEALIVRNRTRVTAELIAGAPRLRVVGRLGVGLDNIDLDACRASGIEVIPATGANTAAVAEYVVCTAMLLLRGAYLSSAAVAEGRWPRAALSNGRESGGKTLGVVGFGGIGRATARLARALGMRAIGHDPLLPDDAPEWNEAGVQPRALEALLSEADAVSLHVPLTSDTRNLIDARRLRLMKRTAVLINTARGGVLDEAALCAALRAGDIAGAALDVFSEEPLPPGTPLAGLPNVILTPHIAGVTRESNERVSELIARRVAECLAGDETR